MKRKAGYKARNNEQLRKWVAGHSEHNKVDDECVPDFSCCYPDLKTDSDTRKYFVEANSAKRNLFKGFLERLLQDKVKTNAKVIAEGDKGTCEECGAAGEVLRPYGKGGKRICFNCGMKDEEEAKRQFWSRM